MGPVAVPDTAAVMLTPFRGAEPEDGLTEMETERLAA